MNEVWKDVPGYEGLYQVSNLGRVKSLDRIDSQGNHRKERILKLDHLKSGYINVSLTKKGILKSFRVHRLVAQVFIPNPNGLPEINHKDEDKHNNKVSNLEWCSRVYNNNYGTRKERSSLAQKGKTISYKTRKKLSLAAQKRAKNVLQLSLNGKILKKWNSVGQTSKWGFCPHSVSICCRNTGRLKTHHGFRWVYEEDYKK